MNRVLIFIKTKWISLTFVSLAVITIFSLLPLNELPSVPGTDKTHHIIAYAILMFPVALRKPDRWVLLGLFFIAYSGAIELLQPFVNRYGEWLDFAANTSGVICGLIVAELNKYFYPDILKRS